MSSSAHVFSCTGNLLSGPFAFPRPDIITHMTVVPVRDAAGHPIPAASREDVANASAYHTLRSEWNKFGYVPFVSSLSGPCRAFFGLVHMIVHLFAAIVTACCCASVTVAPNARPFVRHRVTHLDEAELGYFNVLRGALETIPFIGNGILYYVDKSRMTECEIQAKQAWLKSTHPGNIKGPMPVYYYGELHAFVPLSNTRNYNIAQLELDDILAKKPARVGVAG